MMLGAIAVEAARATAVGDAGSAVAIEDGETTTTGATVGAATVAVDGGWLGVGLQAARSATPTSTRRFSGRCASLFLNMCV
jgi:hypothetical protein